MEETTTKRSKPDNAAKGGSPVYGLGVIGALVYYGKKAESPRDYALVLPKALVWPAVLVHGMLERHGSD